MIRFLHGAFSGATAGTSAGASSVTPSEQSARALQLAEVDNLAADTTILSYLRDALGRTGTKEGCASGDCGACTVVVVERDGETLSYEAINACIAPLGSLDGKQLITVEDLRDPDTGTLHPVQQAMVDSHGSQCGFCTPGFIMSLFSLYHNAGAEPVARETILEALGGNLCRCTGYRPIVEAAQRALQQAPHDAFTEHSAATVAALEHLQTTSAAAPSLTDSGGAYHRPATVVELTSLLHEHPEARMVAGGTDLLLEVTQQLRPLTQLIDICAVDELDRVEITDEHIELGAAVTHRDAQDTLLADYPELAELIERFGSLQIRSRGTVVGNIANASPIGDWPPVLLALGATLQLRGDGGTRDVPIDAFFLDYRKTALQDGEFIESVRIPRRPENLFLRAYKISKRFEDDISSVCGVFALRCQGEICQEARIAFGGMAAIPKRAASCEIALTSETLTEEALERAREALLADFEPISDARASADYRSLVAANLLRRIHYEFSALGATRTHAVTAHGAAHE